MLFKCLDSFPVALLYLIMFLHSKQLGPGKFNATVLYNIIRTVFQGGPFKIYLWGKLRLLLLFCHCFMCVCELQIFVFRDVNFLEKKMAIHSSILTWRIPWTPQPGGLRSVGWQRVRHDWAHSTHMLIQRIIKSFIVMCLGKLWIGCTNNNQVQFLDARSQLQGKRL